MSPKAERRKAARRFARLIAVPAKLLNPEVTKKLKAELLPVANQKLAKIRSNVSTFRASNHDVGRRVPLFDTV